MDQTKAIAQKVGDVLGSGAIGVYLHGSAVLGGLRPASDLDILVVSRETMEDRQRRALLEGLLAISSSAGDSLPVELTVVVRSEVSPWRFPPNSDFLYGEWLRDDFKAGWVPQPRPMPDLALLIAAVLSGDCPLLGPPPARVLDRPPETDLVRASLSGIPRLLADLDFDTRNVVLTLTRIWFTVATGEIRPKDIAAEWAIPRLQPQHRPVLEYAKQLYLTRRYCEESWSDELKAKIWPCVVEILGEIAREETSGRRKTRP